MSTSRRVAELVEQLQPRPHPEGGFYKEVYRSTEQVKVERFGASKDMATSIYYLLSGSEFSSLHRIKQDENWYFHEGGTLIMHDMSPPEGEYQCHALGLDVTKGETPQCTVPARHWFGASLKDSDTFALVGCNVAPGFDFEDLEMGDRNNHLAEFPQNEQLIRRLTRLFELAQLRLGIIINAFRLASC